MTDVETLAERVDTVERAVSDGDHGFPAVDDLAELTERVEALETQVEELNDSTDELEAATQALRGYVGNVRSVNERVEGRADAALAATERLERRLDAATEARGPTPCGDATPAADREASDRTPAAHGVGGTAERHSDDGAGPPEQAARETAGSTTDGRDPGVLEQIRSLL